jgi:hypothetical protein
MTNAKNLPPHSLGLGGDGDEIAAILAVERHFEVQLDYSGADHWKTVGDVFSALKRALPTPQAESSETWPRFCNAISQETGVDPLMVTNETLLLGERHSDWRLLLLVTFVVGLGVAIATHV